MVLFKLILYNYILLFVKTFLYDFNKILRYMRLFINIPKYSPHFS
jgi:hypothetical protein